MILGPRHLKILFAIAHHGFLAAASKVLSMSQPTVSVAIAQLEDIVRAQVVVRHQNGETLPPRRGSGPKGRGRGYVLSHATRELDGLSEVGVGALGAVLTLLPAAHEENLPELLSLRVMRCDLFEI